jgi:capsular polysaccharide biosynthesis protein
MEALPRLSSLERFDELKGVPLIVPRNFKNYHQETLQLLGIRPEVLTHFDDGYWRIERLVFLQSLSATGNPTAQTVSWLRERFLGADRLRTRGTTKLYISRRDTRRTVLNERAIVDYLRSKGFEIVCPGELSVAEQVRLFSQAEIVIGPHGGGMTNMVFAPVGATLIEFFGDNYVNGCFWAATNILQQRHASIISPTNTLDYVVPLPSVIALLEKLGI